MQQDTLIQKASTVGQALAIGAALALSPVAFASAATSTPVPLQGEFASASLSQVVVQQDCSADMQQAMKELAIARSFLGILREHVEAASFTYVDRLDDILDSAVTVASERLPEYAQFFAGRLRSARTDLLGSVTHPKTWLVLSRLVDPEARLVLPERFISRKPASPLEVPVSNLRAAAYLRSGKGPRTA